MEIHILGAHNLESAKSRLVSLLIDDILALDAGSLTSSLSLPAQANIKAILLTHYHFDHIRDIATIGLGTARISTTKVYSTPLTLDTLSSNLISGKIYPLFTQWPSPESPSLEFHPLEPYQQEVIEGYEVMMLPVRHHIPAFGYRVTSGGKSLFYSGDTGVGLSSCWPHLSPQLIITEVSGSNEWEETMRQAGHLTPQLLQQELLEFRKLKGYLPRVVLVHMSPYLEDDIRKEVAQVAKELDADITLAHEGMKLSL
jgi:phosphoribosyl 1,2-cyclic phosphodiesterase